MMSVSQHDPKRLSGRTVLLSLLGFFGVIFAVNGVFAYYAITTYTGIVTEGSYRKGLKYDTQIEAQAAQDRLGWTASLALDDTGRALRLRLSAADGAPLSGRAVRVEVGRPATDRFDQMIMLSEDAPGLYTGDLALPAPGNWIASVAVIEGIGASETTVYRMRQRLWLKPGN
jgi:nitrogen fixation protein FixH